MTNILIPADFTPASLDIAEQALREQTTGSINIILFHAFELPFSEFDMLGSDYKEPARELMNETFRQACRQLKNDYPKQLGRINVSCMNGNTNALFRNFAEANEIDLIYCPDSYTYRKIHARSLDPKNFFKKSGIPVVKQMNRTKLPLFSNPQIAAAAQSAA